ncbi:uncharacterized protein CEXT_721281 [Caerostris extrusa]|uniref:Uncharacterized protein n=1 Tax=Caerostris extrusa TaxID=172846 RepID=A0AAV4Q7Z9_CAEEX|nr:uncharacterized protein CEXT_721281 [Caerostris extrusa]
MTPASDCISMQSKVKAKETGGGEQGRGTLNHSFISRISLLLAALLQCRLCRWANNNTVVRGRCNHPIRACLVPKSPEDPFLCPEANCESEECHHLERSGLCDVVAKGDLEMTVLNCGCCFLCSDRRPAGMTHEVI